jgi:hypothetical protein
MYFMLDIGLFRAFNILKSTLKDCSDKEDVDAERLYHVFIPNGYLCFFLV